MNDGDFSAEERRLQFARQALADELQHRRDKLWKIFSWTSGLLVAVIGGVAAISAKNDMELNGWPVAVAIILAAAALTVYSTGWIHQNLRIEQRVMDSLEKLDKKLGIDQIQWGKPLFGYSMTIVLLCIAAIGASVLTATWS